MKNQSYIKIRFKGARNGVPLSPLNTDLKEVKEFLTIAENFFDKDRETVSVQIEEGSLVYKLFAPLALSTMFNIHLAFLLSNEIDKVPSKTIQAFNKISALCKKYNVEAELSTSESQINTLSINKDTEFVQSKNTYINTEFNFIGFIYDAGGIDNVNIHLQTQEYGTLIIKAEKDFIASISNNFLFRYYSVIAEGLADYITGEFDKNTLKLISLTEFNPVFDKEEFDQHIKNTAHHWDDVEDIDLWLNEVRGYNE